MFLKYSSSGTLRFQFTFNRIIGHAWPHAVLYNDDIHSECVQLFHSPVDLGGICSIGCVLMGTILLGCILFDIAVTL